MRHEIVHNRYVVEGLEAKGAVFVEDLDEVPADVPVIFSAHGVPKTVPAEAESRNLFYLDATCPLVSKVHREAERHHRNGRQIILIGHAGHPEVIGTMGQLPEGSIVLVESIADAESVEAVDPSRLAFITQTTLSVDDTASMIADPAPPLPGYLRAQERGHLLRHDQPPTGGQVDRLALRRAPGRRRAQLVQLATPGRGGTQAGLRERHAGPARRRHRLAEAGRRGSASASPPAPRRPTS